MRRLAPTVGGRPSWGAFSVLVNPGAWLFFATTASAVLAAAAADGGRAAAMVTAVAMVGGVSTSDVLFSVVGSGGAGSSANAAWAGYAPDSPSPS